MRKDILELLILDFLKEMLKVQKMQTVFVVHQNILLQKYY